MQPARCVGAKAGTSENGPSVYSPFCFAFATIVRYTIDVGRLLLVSETKAVQMTFDDVERIRAEPLACAGAPTPWSTLSVPSLRVESYSSGGYFASTRHPRGADHRTRIRGTSYATLWRAESTTTAPRPRPRGYSVGARQFCGSTSDAPRRGLKPPGSNSKARWNRAHHAHCRKLPGAISAGFEPAFLSQPGALAPGVAAVRYFV